MSPARQAFARSQEDSLDMRVIIGVSVVLIATSAWGQQLYIYPQRGQSFDQQAVDKAECQRWANQQTGYNPAAPPPPPMAGAPQGGMFRGAAGGAALSAVGGAIGGDAGKGAAIGAGVGAAAGLIRQNRNNRQSAEATRQAQSQQQAGLQQYESA